MNINESIKLMIRMGDLPENTALSQQEHLFEMANLSQKRQVYPL